jgi:hypothetical protein
VPEEVCDEQTRENRRFALTCAARACGGGSHSLEDVLRVADSFFEWLEGPGTA